MAAKKRWIVTTSGDQPLNELKKKLTDTGFTVDQVFDEIGSVIGTGGDDIAEKLRRIPGVADVSPEGNIDIGPPDAPVTW